MGCGDVRLLRTSGGVDVTGQERAALNKLTMPSQTFLLAAIALIVATSAVGAIPYIGEVVTRIIANLVLFLGGAVLVVAVKSLFTVARD